MGRFSFIYLFTFTPVWGGVKAVNLYYVFLPTVMAQWDIGRVEASGLEVSHLRIANRTEIGRAHV